MRITLIGVRDDEVDMPKLEEALKRCQREAGAKIIMGAVSVPDNEDPPMARSVVMAAALTIAEAFFPDKGKVR
jgi:hypothetical protein